MEVLPSDAHEFLIKETKRAFYAGAGSALALFEIIGQDSISNDRKEAMIDGMINEITRFRNSVLSATD